MKKYCLFKQMKKKTNMRDSHFETNLPHANCKVKQTVK